MHQADVVFPTDCTGLLVSEREVSVPVEVAVNPIGDRGEPRQAARIVVIDDDNLVREAMSKYLLRCGYAVAAFACGRDAMRSLVQDRADLVITDLLMPDTDGLEVLMKVRTLAPRPKVIVISGGGVLMEGTMAATRQLGAVATLFKPFNLAELLTTVRSVLGNKVP